MARSVWKGPFVDINLLKKLKKYLTLEEKKLLKLGQEDQLYYLNLLV